MRSLREQLVNEIEEGGIGACLHSIHNHRPKCLSFAVYVVHLQGSFLLGLTFSQMCVIINQFFLVFVFSAIIIQRQKQKYNTHFCPFSTQIYHPKGQEYVAR